MPPALGKVAGNLGKRADISLRVANRGDDHVGPESRTVLSQPPAFVLESSSFPRSSELLVGPAALDSIRRIEGAEVLSDDFVRTVPLDPLGPRVPCANESVRVEKKDGVIRDPLDQLAKTLVGAKEVVGGGTARIVG